MYNVFIDGSAGTTGLKIVDRLSKRKDINLITLPDDKRKEIKYRKEALNSCDIAFLCLPDDAARESVSLIENKKVKVIDTSTAHRTAKGWVYGFAELEGMREKIRNGRFIANPGCHASGFIALIEPLIRNKLISPSLPLSCFSITGYTGGGKKMIAEYESENMPELYKAPRQYGLGQTHKHLPEMTKICKLKRDPIFCPIVAPFPTGMEVSVPLFAKDVKADMTTIQLAYAGQYNDGIVRFNPDASENGFLSAQAFSGRDDMEISVYGNDSRYLLVARFDNLGKGASGAAIQNMNIMLGVDETTGLEL